MRQATAALTALSDVDNDEENSQKFWSTLLRQLETRAAQALDDLQNAQNDLASYNSQLVSLQTQPERVQNAMYITLRSSCNKFVVVWMGLMSARLPPSQPESVNVRSRLLLNAETDQQRKA